MRLCVCLFLFYLYGSVCFVCGLLRDVAWLVCLCVLRLCACACFLRVFCVVCDRLCDVVWCVLRVVLCLCVFVCVVAYVCVLLVNY